MAVELVAPVRSGNGEFTARKVTGAASHTTGLADPGASQPQPCKTFPPCKTFWWAARTNDHNRTHKDGA
jgi:hypothetical protein